MMAVALVAVVMLAGHPADAALRVARGQDALQAEQGAAMPNGCAKRNGPPGCFKVSLRHGHRRTPAWSQEP